MSEQPIEAITGYHAHVYYDTATRNAAAQVRKAMEERFEVQMGRWRDESVGPHPQSMYQVAFSPSEFARVVPWLALNRAGLVVFIHPNTGDDYADHAVHALWLGEKLVLKLDVFDPNRSAKIQPGNIATAR